MHAPCGCTFPSPSGISPAFPSALYCTSCLQERSASPFLSTICALFAQNCRVPLAHCSFFAPDLRCWLSPAESALTDDLRVLPEIGRNNSAASPLESALTAITSVSALESALTRKRGVGYPRARGARYPSNLSVATFAPFAGRFGVTRCPKSPVQRDHYYDPAHR